MIVMFKQSYYFILPFKVFIPTILFSSYKATVSTYSLLTYYILAMYLPYTCMITPTNLSLLFIAVVGR